MSSSGYIAEEQLVRAVVGLDEPTVLREVEVRYVAVVLLKGRQRGELVLGVVQVDLVPSRRDKGQQSKPHRRALFWFNIS